MFFLSNDRGSLNSFIILLQHRTTNVRCHMQINQLNFNVFMTHNDGIIIRLQIEYLIYLFHQGILKSEVTEGLLLTDYNDYTTFR